MNQWEEFKNPPAKYRPIPFWSWNDKLDPEELKRQVHEMKKAGSGGYFMHARSGLKTGYLSEEWFECIRAGIEAGKEAGLNAWIYDEEGWPSGFAGGRVPERSERFQAKFMTMERFEYGKDGIVRAMEHADCNSENGTAADRIPWERVIAAYVREAADSGVSRRSDESGSGEYGSGEKPGDSGYRRLALENGRAPEGFNLKPGQTLLAVYRHVNPYYIDTLCKGAVDAFLECTHEEYYRRFGEEFGTHMQGFFTDEPRLACNHFGELAWSDDLPEEFLKQYGYDILDHLPALYEMTDGYEKYRYDFWSLVSRMFSENYMKNIQDWCREHHCRVTGHIMMEESIFSQMTSTAGVMPFYEYMDVPGIDWLRRQIESPVTPKQAGSVACQLGKKQVLTESYALCGWNVSFEELKWIAEWQFVNGVNQICQHLMAYTIAGGRKRDYPPSHFTQQTWWAEYGRFQDYLGRLCAALSKGDQTADVLLIHPMKSGYIDYDGTRTEQMRAIDQEFTEISCRLSGDHVSYHYGDETIIKKYGSVSGKVLMVGRVGYRAVILPRMDAMEGRTVELLLEFIGAGGRVIRVSRFPHYTNGDMGKLRELREKTEYAAPEQVRTLLQKDGLAFLSVAENVRGTAEGTEITDISCQQRRDKDEAVVFFANHSQINSHDAVIRIYGTHWKVTGLEAETGEMLACAYEFDGDDTVFPAHFEPMGSLLVVLEPSEEVSLKTEEAQTEILELKPGWDVEEMDRNSMTLDTCAWRMDGGEWQKEVPVIHLQEILLNLRRSCDIELLFSFEVQMDLENNREFLAAVEDLEKYRMEVNGQPVDTRAAGWWKDQAFRTVSIRPYVKTGMNTLVLKTSFHQRQKVYDVLFGEDVYETEKNKLTYDMELESIYLLGDFAVESKSSFTKLDRRAMKTDGGFVIRNAPLRIRGNELTTEGFLFFAGTVVLTKKLHINKREGVRLLLNLGRQNAPLVKVYVNDVLIKDSLWAPYTADITSAAVDGENTVKLKLYASNRNLLGPHHHIDGECYNVGPESFTGRWSWVERKSEADATDIEDRTKSYWTDSYSFVEFGLGEA